MPYDLPRLALCASAVVLAMCAGCTAGGSPHATPAAGTRAASATGTRTAATGITTGGAATPATSPAHSAQVACGGTGILAGRPPAWNAQPAGFTQQPTFLSYVVGSANSVMGYLWGNPLYVPEPGGRINKILWYVRYPPNGAPLQLTGHLVTNPARTVTESFPNNSGPGWIYPSDVVVPQTGCWSFTLRWASHTDHLSLRFTPPPR
jgi:hypothetical protein